jgi:hypothetical protein
MESGFWDRRYFFFPSFFFGFFLLYLDFQTSFLFRGWVCVCLFWFLENGEAGRKRGDMRA